MSRRIWRRILSVLVVVVAAALTGLVWARTDLERVSWVWSVVGAVFGAFVVIRQVLRDRDADRGASAAQRRAVAEDLAEQVRRDPLDGALLRSLEEPYPLPVSWANAPAEYQPSWRTICRSSEGGPLDLSGRDGEVPDTYRRIPSGRMLVLGHAGSGKSILAVRLARRLVGDATPGNPIPVLLYLASWDPGTTRFDEWVVDQIVARYPQLATVHPRVVDALRHLLDADLILPILDGLDETTEEQAALCLRRLNEVSTRRLVLTCRTGFYNRYLQYGEKLRGAAVIRIEPLDPGKVAAYLVDAAPLSQVTRWRPVAEEMTARAGGELATALSTPLLVAMARIAFDEHDPPTRMDASRIAPDEVEPDDNNPGVLVDLARRSGRQAVEEHLLTSAVEVAIRPYRDSWLRWPTAMTRRYLSFLAGHLESRNRREFAWWQLPAELPALFWALFDGVRAALAAWLTLALAGDTVRSTVAGIEDTELRETLAVLTFGTGGLVTVVGLLAVLVSVTERQESYQGVPPVRIAYRGGLRALGAGLVGGTVLGALAARLFWVAAWLSEPARGIVTVLEPYAPLPGPWSDESRVAVAVGLAVGVCLAVWSGLRIDFAAPVGRSAMTDPGRAIRADQAATVLSALPAALLGVVVTLLLCGALFLAGVLPDVAVREQVVVGLGLGLGGWLWSWSGSAGVRTALTRLLLAATGRLPYRLPQFLVAVESVGLLRNVGGAYRFRHDRVQNVLANLEGPPGGLRRQEEFHTELARNGYWDEARAGFGGLVDVRAGRPGSDPLLAAALRKTVFVGCAAGRWWRTERRLRDFLALYPVPEVPGAQEVTACRREITDLVRQGATAERLLTACETLLDAEAVTGRVDPASVEFHRILRYVLGEPIGIHLSGEWDQREHSAPVGAALRVRTALADGNVRAAMVASRYELEFTRISPRPGDLARLAETWWWSVQVLSRAGDEVSEQRRRITEAARPALDGGRPGVSVTSREWAEIGLLVCRRRVSDPLVGGLAVAVARGLLERVDTPERFLVTVNRAAPLWSDSGLPPPPTGTDDRSPADGPEPARRQPRLSP